MLVAFLGVVIVFWLHTFAHFLVIMCAVLLAKIDTQAANFSDRLVFRIVSFVSLLGLFLGGIIEYLISILLSL